MWDLAEDHFYLVFSELVQFWIVFWHQLKLARWLLLLLLGVLLLGLQLLLVVVVGGMGLLLLLLLTDAEMLWLLTVTLARPVVSIWWMREFAWVMMAGSGGRGTATAAVEGIIVWRLVMVLLRRLLVRLLFILVSLRWLVDLTTANLLFENWT